MQQAIHCLCRRVGRRHRQILLIAIFSLAGVLHFGGSIAVAQPDLVVTRISVRALSASSLIRGQPRYAARIDVTVANVAPPAIRNRVVPIARTVTLHLKIARVLGWTSALRYTDLPVYTCDYITNLDCAWYAQFVQLDAPLQPGESRNIPIVVQVTGQARAWADPTRGLEGTADVTPGELACGFFPFGCALLSIFDVDVDRSRLFGCKGRTYCYSILAVVNRDNLAGEARAARLNNFLAREVRLPPQRLRPLGL